MKRKNNINWRFLEMQLNNINSLSNNNRTEFTFPVGYRVDRMFVSTIMILRQLSIKSINNAP